MLRSVFAALALSIPLFGNMASAQAAKALVPAYVPPDDATSWQPLYSQYASTHTANARVAIRAAKI